MVFEIKCMLHFDVPSFPLFYIPTKKLTHLWRHDVLVKYRVVQKSKQPPN